MKRKRKKKVQKRMITILLILLVFVVGRKVYYNYKLNHYDNIINSYAGALNHEKVNSVDDLESLSNRDSKIATIMQNRDEYPEILLEMLSRNLDMKDYVLGYLDSKGKVFSDDIGKVKKGKCPLLLQYDTRWGYGMYGDDVIAINGCGPTSVAMVIAGLTGRNDITPYDVATYSYENGHYANGTSWSLFTKGVNHYGIIGKELPLSKSVMISELKQNHPIICSMGKGDFTTTGHIIVIAGVKDGKFIINDSNSKERSNRLWSYEEIQSQIKNLWSFRLDK